MKQLIIASTSTIYEDAYLNYLKPSIKDLFHQAQEIVFVPYARPSGISYEAYTDIAKSFFSNFNISVKGIHEYKNPVEGIKNAKGIFTGGGNTFVLVNQLYRNKLIQPLKESIKSGVPYLGTSAGSNICGLTIGTTNDMPIVYPESFKTLGIVPFNINPHYLDPDPNTTHKGETREVRIQEFHEFNTQPVIGLREGSWLEVKDETILLKGDLSARIFEYGKKPYEVTPNTDLSNLK